MNQYMPGGGGYSFEPGSLDYRSYETRGRDSIDGTFHYTSHSFAGATYNDGKADAFDKVKDGLDPEALQQKAQAWGGVHTHVDSVATRLSNAYNDTFAAWSGDDADTARKTFGHTVDSAGATRDYSLQMKNGTTSIAQAAAAAKGTSSSGPSTGAKIVNGALGFGGGEGDGGQDEQAYFNLVDGVSGGRDEMPTTVQWQTKTAATSPSTNYGGHSTGGAGSAGGVSGVSAPTTGAGSAAHTSVGTSGVGQTGTQLVGPKKPPKVREPTYPPIEPIEPTTPVTGTTSTTGGVDGGSVGGVGGTGVDGSGLHGVGVDGSGVNGTGVDGSGLHGVGVDGSSSSGGSSGIGALKPVGLDNSSTLAGIDGGGGAGGSLGGAGGALSGSGVGAGGASIGGAGSTGGLSGSSGLAGGVLGAGGAGSGAGSSGTRSSGIGAEGSGGGGAAGGRGAPGMMPMRGGGQGGDEDERERSTWLNEDDDVWGESDAPPSVIS